MKLARPGVQVAVVVNAGTNLHKDAPKVVLEALMNGRIMNDKSVEIVTGGGLSP